MASNNENNNKEFLDENVNLVNVIEGVLEMFWNKGEYYKRSIGYTQFLSQGTYVVVFQENDLVP